MSRRHEALIPLTHDHHHALAQARRLTQAAASEDVKARQRAADDFVNFYLGRALPHFREEEERFFPTVSGRDEGRDLVIRAVLEHLDMHGLVRMLRRSLRGGNPDASLLAEIGTVLASHVRFEEDELFPLIEELADSKDLDELAASGRRTV